MCFHLLTPAAVNPQANQRIRGSHYADSMTVMGSIKFKRVAALPMAISLLLVSFLGGCSSEKKPLDVITSDGVTQNSASVDETILTEDTAGDVPASLVALIKKNTGVEDTIGECVGGNLMDAYGVDKASKIAALPATDTSDDRVVLDQAVLDCRG
jgi:hypothetical protein